MAAASKLDLRQTDVLVLSACVQMPSLDLVEKAEETFGLPVVTASTAAAFTLLRQLDLAPQIPDAGVLLRPSSASKPSTNSALKVDERLIKEK
jgi:maleate isomerase